MSVFIPKSAVETLRENCRRLEWGGAVVDGAVAQAKPWMAMTREHLWDLMFGPTITRSWMVWSNGHCPSCRRSVPMYTWQIDAIGRPWKVICPECRDEFPKNDFHAFYRSGLDGRGVFDPARADRRLLFNAEHPDPKDPLHGYGVDDGEGYVDGEKRWRFIGAYLIYGQWKQAVLGGIGRLAAAYVVTGEASYAQRAMILLDRVADLYPEFDFLTQALCYEHQYDTSTGYVSMWHDACEETREMVLAYDAVKDGVEGDAELVSFLSRQAQAHGSSNRKGSIGEVCRNIEERILKDALRNPEKVKSNPPRTDIAIVITKAVLGWPANRDELLADMDRMIEGHTRVDGVTGEKGLAGYSAFVIQSMAAFLQRFEQVEPGFIREMLRRHPQLHKTWRFHVDTWCLQKYYPTCGDSGWFAQSIDRYQGCVLRRRALKRGDTDRAVFEYQSAAAEPSMFSFLWRLYEATNDVAFVQVMHRGNDDSEKNLPWDLFCPDPGQIERSVGEIIGREGPRIRLGNVNLREWHLAILRSGAGPQERAVWLDYDSGNRHAHMDAMNLGLYAHGLDLMPDFGYPPVQFGGWGAPRSLWYMQTAAHNTVVVDGKNQIGTQFSENPRGHGGNVTLWAEAAEARGIRVSGASLYPNARQYERTIWMVDVSPEHFYVLDVFRVVGGKDHAKFIHSHFGTAAAKGLNLRPAEDYGFNTQMRAFQSDPHPPAGWMVDWAVEDRYGLLSEKKDIHLRYTDLTSGGEASLCEAWIVPGAYTKVTEEWIPRVMVRRRAEAEPLASTFVGVVEPYEGASSIASVRRLPLVTPEGISFSDSHVAVEVRLSDGRADLFIAADVENPLGKGPAYEKGTTLVQPDWSVHLRGELCVLRRGLSGAVEPLALGNVTALRSGGARIL